MSPTSSSASYQDANQKLFSALLILGLDVPALEKKLRITIDKNSISKMGKSLAQYIFHFCFVCIDPEKASKNFRDIWPVIDKKQEAQFNKVIFEWYKVLHQGQGSGTSEIIVKSAVIPGGPKFGKTLNNLIRMAVVAKIKRKSPDGITLHPPTYTNRVEFDCTSLTLQEAWKAKHRCHFTNKHFSHHKNLKKISQKSKEIVEVYRTLCKELECNQSALRDKMTSLEFLTAQQRLDFLTASPEDIKIDLKKTIEGKNSEVGYAWKKIDQYASVEQSAWTLISPLLDGSSALSHIDGKLYAPQVPQQILKEHAATISKTGLSSVYRNGVLDLLSLVQFCNLCIKSIGSCMTANQFQNVNQESSVELATQSGRVKSMQESLSQTRENLDTRLEQLIEDVAHHRNTLLTTMSFEDSICNKSDPTTSINEGGPPQLCFPTPPIKLGTSLNCSQSTLNKFMPLTLTPGPGGREVSNPREACVPVTPIHSTGRMTRAARRSPKADVQYSPATHTNTAVDVSVHETSIQCEAEAGLTLELLTVDCRAQHQKSKEDHLSKLMQRPSHLAGPPRTEFKTSKSAASNSNVNKKIGKENQISKHVKINSTNEDRNLQNKVKRSILSSSENKKRQEIDVLKPKHDINHKYTSDMEDQLLLEVNEDSGAGDSLGEVTVIDSNVHKNHSSKCDSGLIENLSDDENEESLLDVLEMLDVNNSAKKLHVTSAEVSSPYLGFASPKLRRSASGSLEERLGMGSPQHTIIASPRRSISSPRNRISLVHGLNGLSSPSLRRSISQSLGEKMHRGRLSLLQVEKKSIGNVKPPGLGFVTPTTSPQKPSKLIDLTPNASSVIKLIDLSDDRTLTPGTPTESPGFKSRPFPKFMTRLEEKVGSILSPKMNKAGINSEVESSSKLTEPSIEILKHKSKTNLTNLVKQVRKMRSQSIGEFCSPKKDLLTGRPRFLSYVENLKKEDMGLVPVKSDAVKPCVPDNQIVEEENITSQFDRLNALLGDLDENTTPINTPKKTKIEDEDFIDGGFFATLDNTPRRRSRFLPEDSVFETLADSILYGETDSSILQQDDAQTEMQKEIIFSRRQSLATNRMSIGGVKRLSGIYTSLSNRVSSEHWIMDEKDDLLLWDSP